MESRTSNTISEVDAPRRLNTSLDDSQVLPINTIIQGDCIEVMKTFPENSIDSICCDPPYGLEFMGKEWDKFKEGKNIAGGTTGLNTPFGKKRALPSFYQLRETTVNKKSFKKGKGSHPRGYVACNLSVYQQFTFQWAQECLRVLKPGGYLLSFGGTRTFHRLGAGLEDAGFEIRDCIMWIYSSGFPKSHNVANAIDKLQGLSQRGHAIASGSKYHPTTGKARAPGEFLPPYKARTELAKQWEGWGTALKPAVEPICVARKPLSEKNVASNVLKWGTGGINIDGSRINYQSEKDKKEGQSARQSKTKDTIFPIGGFDRSERNNIQGRFPANLMISCCCDYQLKSGIMEENKKKLIDWLYENT